MIKNVLIINGHPDKESLCSKISNVYFESAIKSANQCKLINLADLKFNPILNYGCGINYLRGKLQG